MSKVKGKNGKLIIPLIELAGIFRIISADWLRGYSFNLVKNKQKDDSVISIYNSIGSVKWLKKNERILVKFETVEPAIVITSALYDIKRKKVLRSHRLEIVDNISYNLIGVVSNIRNLITGDSK